MLLVSCAALLACSGCGRSGWQNDDGVRFTPNAAPAAPRTIDLSTSTPSTPSDDPQLPRGGENPLTDAADPITKDQPDSPATDSLLTENRGFGNDGGGGGRGGKAKGWYWVVGSIRSGQVGIAVNGTPVGRYSVHVDKEITQYCHPGLNTLTFTHYPLLGTGEQVCEAHLEIVNGHAPKGSPPVMVYDTSAAASDERAARASAPSAATLPDDTGGDNALSATGVDSSGNPDSAAPSAGASAPSSAATASAAPYSDQTSFSGS